MTDSSGLPVGRLFGSRELLVQVTKLADGGTGVRVDAQVQWIIPRPVSERIPRGVHEIDVTRAAPGEAPSLEVKVVVSARDPSAGCDGRRARDRAAGRLLVPRAAGQRPVVTFTFRASDGGHRARERQRAGVGQRADHLLQPDDVQHSRPSADAAAGRRRGRRQGRSPARSAPADAAVSAARNRHRHARVAATSRAAGSMSGSRAPPPPP